MVVVMLARVDIKTGFACNNRCLFCVQGDKRERHADRTTDELRAILQEAREAADGVVFTGGEVTLRPDLFDLVDWARTLGFSVIQIQTNGRRLAYMDYVAGLIRAGATEFSPAVHGPDAAVHDALTQAPGSFRQTVQGIRNVTRLGRPVLINSVITRANFRLLPEMAALFVELGVAQFQFAFVHALGSAGEHFEEVVPRLSEVRPYALAGLERGIDAGVRCMTEAIPLCFLPGLQHCAAEWLIPRTRIYDVSHVVDDYTDYRLTEGKAKGEPCGRCALDDVCEGPWKEYPERFGWGEFEPIAREGI